MRPTLLLLALVPAALTGCGDASAPAGTAAPEEVVGVGLVLDDGSGPELCLGGVAESLPPQCSGPPVVGLDWDDVEHEATGGVRWGDAALTGTWDGERFTLTRPPSSPEEVQAPGPDDAESLETPCAEPAGGWRRGASVGDADFARAARAADRSPEVGAVWVDEGRGALAGLDQDEVDALIEAPPPRVVLNVTVVGGETERAAVERRLREVWDGDVCVVTGARSSGVERREIADDLASQVPTSDGNWLGVTGGRDVVELDVVLDDGSLQAELDERYGRGVVEVTSALRPVGD